MEYLLTAHILNGLKVGVETPIISAIEEPFKIEKVVSSGYADISTIENWWDYGRDHGKDYLFIRKRIKNLIKQKGMEQCLGTISDPPISPADGDIYCIASDAVATGDWTGYEGFAATWDEANTQWVKEPPDWVGYRVLNNTEKLIAAGYKIGSQVDHFTDYGVPAISDYGLEYHRNSQEARAERLLRTAAEVYNRLGMFSGTVLSHLIGNPHGDLTNLYKEWGVKGTLEDFNVDFNPTPTPGVIDYLYSRAPYTGEKVYIDTGYPLGLSQNNSVTVIDGTPLSDFCDELYEILVEGNW